MPFQVTNTWISSDRGITDVSPTTIINPCLSSLQNIKMSDFIKLKALADESLNLTQIMEFVFYRKNTLLEKLKMLMTSISSFKTKFSTTLLGANWKVIKKVNAIGF